MNIEKQIVTSANWDVGRNGQAITGIVLHTIDGTTESAYERFNNPTSNVSAHYGVSLDGSVREWVEEPNTAYQAGNWDVNLRTIGIEHEDNKNPNDSIRTPQLYESSAQLVASICKKYDFPADRTHIFPHKEVIDTNDFPGGTSCPDGLDINKIITMAAAILEGDTMTNALTKEEVEVLYMLSVPGQAVNQGFVEKYTGQNLDDTLHALQNDPSIQAYISKLLKGASPTKANVLTYLQDNLQ